MKVKLVTGHFIGRGRANIVVIIVYNLQPVVLAALTVWCLGNGGDKEKGRGGGGAVYISSLITVECVQLAIT